MVRLVSSAQENGILAVLVLASVTVVGASVVWTSESTLTTTATTPPVHLDQGVGASNNRYIKSLTLSPDKTYATAELKARAGAYIEVADVLRVTNPEGSPQTVGLEGNQVSNANIEAFRWRVRDGATVLAILDHKDASPSASFTVPAGSHLTLDLVVDTADGSGKNNANVDFDLRLVPP